ncbi:response regulator [Leucobacter soli]|uniref:Transcriptional regulatory protein LiaR n=1 Tax=Leucobacter soli TaxID=2812850 RepID=A0A916JY26_9MICO|nr:response regulator transcription factor [Leucobacter soli]CAG7613542.1 Transcriptional regulatory protein LiaR [Leucobacter soli]
MTAPTRILVVDDDALAAAGVAAVLGTAEDLAVVGTRSDGDQVEDAIHELHPDVVLCDVRMPRVDGISVVRRLVGMPGAPRFLMMTAFDDDGVVLQAIDAGAIGFIHKDEDPHRILDAVRAAALGEAPFSPRAAVEITGWARSERTSARRLDALAKMERLTVREREFALAVMTGASDAEIAAQMFVSETTVKSALAAIRTKWDARNRTDLAVIVAHSGLG